MLHIQRLGLFFFGNVMIILSVLGYEKSIADTMLYLTNPETGAWHAMAVSVVCFIAGNILIITGARMNTTKVDTSPLLSETLPDKLD